MPNPADIPVTRRKCFVETKPGKGVFIAQRRAVLSRGERRRRVQESLRRFLREATCEGFDAEEIRTELEKELARMRRDQKGGRG